MPKNPAPPEGVKLWKKAVPAELTDWASTILHDATSYPMFSEVTRPFGEAWVLARVEWHDWTFRNGVKVTGTFRGVTLYEMDGPPGGSEEAPSV